MYHGDSVDMDTNGVFRPVCSDGYQRLHKSMILHGKHGLYLLLPLIGTTD